MRSRGHGDADIHGKPALAGLGRCAEEAQAVTHESFGIANHPSSCVKAALPGVEFDVKFEADKTSCHVIAIFNVKDWARDAYAIKDAIGSRLLTQKEAAYDVGEFEALSKDTGLDFMLIAHQHEGLTINPKKRSTR